MGQNRRTFLKLTIAGLALADSRVMAAETEDIRIGVLTPLTGGGAFFGGEMQKTYEALAAEINSAGGIKGRKLQLLTQDDQTNSDAAVRAARKLVDVDHVVAIMGTFASSETLAVMPILATNKIPLMTVSSSPAITTANKDGYVFRTAPSDALGSAVFAIAAQKKGFKKAALLLQNSPYGLGLGDSFVDPFKKVGGEITAKVVYNLNQASYRSEIEQAFAGQPDVILFGGYTPDGIQIFKEAYQLGMKATWMSFAWAFSPEFVTAVGVEAAQSCLTVDPIPNSQGSAFADADKLFRAATGKPADLFVAMAYDHLMLISLAIFAGNGDSSGDGIKMRMRTISNPPGKVVGTWAEAIAALGAGEKINYEGASGSCDFDEHGDTITVHGIFSLKGGEQKLEFTVSPAEVQSL
jgi:branched-chain amino acid transport system substrate-binding protein